MQVEKLKILEQLHYDEKNVTIELVDGSSVFCTPWDWSYEEDYVAYTVKLLKPLADWPSGTFYTVKNEDIVRITAA